jgi:hypothetical protein
VINLPAWLDGLGTLVILILVMVVSSGCVAGGMAAGPLLASLVAIGDRSVERTLPADLPSAWDATLEGLARMGVRVDEADRAGDKWTLGGKGGAITLHGALEGVTAGMSRLSLRVEAGGFLADKRTAEEILNQVTMSLRARAATGEPKVTSAVDVSAEQMAALRREMQQLGTKIEEAGKLREAEPPAATTPSATTIKDRIVVVPTSVGVPTVTAPEPASRSQGLRSAAPPAQSHGGAGEPMPAQRPPLPAELPARLLPSPLQAADVLAPAGNLVVPSNDR